MRFFRIAQSPKSCAIVMRSHLTLAAHRKSKVVLSDFYYVASEAYSQQSPKNAKKEGFFYKRNAAKQHCCNVWLAYLESCHIAYIYLFAAKTLFTKWTHCLINHILFAYHHYHQLVDHTDTVYWLIAWRAFSQPAKEQQKSVWENKSATQKIRNTIQAMVGCKLSVNL